MPELEFSDISKDDRGVRPRTAELQGASEQKSRSVIPPSPRRQMKRKLKNSVKRKGKESLKNGKGCSQAEKGDTRSHHMKVS